MYDTGMEGTNMSKKRWVGLLGLKRVAQLQNLIYV